MIIELKLYLLIGAALFCLGILAVIIKRNAIMTLMGIELIFNAANVNLVAFSRFDQNFIQGQMVALFIIIIAACETAVGLALIMQIYNYFKTIELDKINELKDN